jgi:hypothetical protein
METKRRQVPATPHPPRRRRRRNRNQAPRTQAGQTLGLQTRLTPIPRNVTHLASAAPRVGASVRAAMRHRARLRDRLRIPDAPVPRSPLDSPHNVEETAPHPTARSNQLVLLQPANFTVSRLKTCPVLKFQVRFTTVRGGGAQALGKSLTQAETIVSRPPSSSDSRLHTHENPSLRHSRSAS